MQIPRRALWALSTTVVSAVAAWSTTSPLTTALVGRSTVVSRAAASALSRATTPASLMVQGRSWTTWWSSSSSSRTGLQMIFGNLFGGGSGSSSSSSGVFGRKIDYSSLDHPGPELGQWAAEGKVPTVSERDPNLALATFAGGCFWGLELAYQRVPGVAYTAVGYTQGAEEYPTYGQVCSGTTGHTEALIVYYDPKEVSYEQLLDVYFGRVDPTTVNGQGNDRGRQYRTGVYYHTPEQEAAAKARCEQEQKKYGPRRRIASELKPAQVFWPAEKYHQQYLEKGGRMGQPQDASKGATAPIRCYG